MLEVNLLGTGGMVPLPDRFLTSLVVRYKGTTILIDCGEGTQIAIRAAGLSFKQIGVICLTHFHADHVAGLPGLLLTIGNSGRTEPIVIIGPQYVGQVVDCLRIIAPQLPFEIEYREIQENREAFTMDSLTIYAHPVEHWIPCYAYKLEIKRQGKFDAKKARALEIPVMYWSVLQSGTSVQMDGHAIPPSAVMGKERKGIRLCYATDLRPSDSLAEFADHADLFICEGMYGDPEMLEKAIQHRHCLFGEAAAMAKQAQVKELWLTHFSPSMPNPGEYYAVAEDIFPNVWIDKKNAILRFEDGKAEHEEQQG